jgi:hypothetical protein
MMKITFVLLCTFLLTTASFATVSSPLKHQNTLVNKKQIKHGASELEKTAVFERQCCTQSAFDSDGNLIEVTACAGWFLSNDIKAHDRACDKALAGLEALVPNP